MQENPSQSRDSRRNPRSNAGQDALIERALLSLVLVSHPDQLTFAELVRELSEDPEHPAQRDAVERAVRDLTGSGLLHRHGPFVLPTRAALRFDRLALA
ncbi:MAG TPA: hypothetical protein VNY83_00885 [Solirubrobacterales bacterium]|jgi:hypothetical protein|nr:hypothetical protein [Solirubrobacterales bacterium]